MMRVKTVNLIEEKLLSDRGVQFSVDNVVLSMISKIHPTNYTYTSIDLSEYVSPKYVNRVREFFMLLGFHVEGNVVYFDDRDLHKLIRLLEDVGVIQVVGNSINYNGVIVIENSIELMKFMKKHRMI